MSTYPAHCVARLERRTVPGENGRLVLSEIQSVIEAAHAADRTISATARLTLERDPSEVAASAPVSKAVREAATLVLGKDPDIVGVPYWMDMALINTSGIPAVAFGPSGGGEHADVEWVEVDSVEKCVEVYLRAAERLCA